MTTHIRELKCLDCAAWRDGADSCGSCRPVPNRPTIRVSAAGFYGLQRELQEANERATRAEKELAKVLEKHWQLIQDMARDQRAREHAIELEAHERRAARAALGCPSEIPPPRVLSARPGSFAERFMRSFGL
jgi:hypothetical protein